MASAPPHHQRPVADSAPVAIIRTLPGRVFALSAVSFAVLWIAQQFTTLPPFLETFRKVASLGVRLAGFWLLALVVVRYRRAFLWRVRRKLILSYLFLGFVPVVLVGLFTLAAGFVLHASIAGYLLREGIDDALAEVHQVAATAAAEISTNPERAEAVLDRKYTLLAMKYKRLSLVVVPVAGATQATESVVRADAGAWTHLDPPTSAPDWIAGRDFQGLLAMIPEGLSATDSDAERLLIRAAVPLADQRHMVIADLPVDTDLSARLDEVTSVRMTSVAVGQESSASNAAPAAPLPARRSVLPESALTDDDGERDDARPWDELFRRSVLFADFVDWNTGATGLVSIGLDAPLHKIYRHVATASAGQRDGEGFWYVLVGLGGLLLVVQSVALFFGVNLGRQITYAIHELSEGTERVRQGDFGHRISIDTDDQLGALGEAHNRMSAGMEHLLHVQREKQRLDDELRIAHEIQTSLLPERPPTMPGLTIADLCVPAREVGGDYYDFFVLGPRQLGILVADVSGKGTSAALYMAELKGLMLALAQAERSPKQLLTRVNALLADHLDNRSFITATYAVLDLDARTLTHARAGHTPLMVASARAPELAEVLTPSGMVLGLRLPGAADRFESILEEHTLPLEPGDAIAFYTDGITEAMNSDDELFGDAALGRVLVAHRDLDALGLRERVLRDVQAWVGAAEPHDDMTMVIVKVEATA
jgi:serine phosphatase RsbU (regulator of sigma subunit)